MDAITFNDDNLARNEINEITTKVRAILFNDKNEILLANYGGVYLFPGGTLETGESIEATLAREVLAVIDKLMPKIKKEDEKIYER